MSSPSEHSLEFSTSGEHPTVKIDGLDISDIVTRLEIVSDVEDAFFPELLRARITLLTGVTIPDALRVLLEVEQTPAEDGPNA